MDGGLENDDAGRSQMVQGARRARRPSQKWTPDEDQRLIIGVHLHQGRRWSEISRHVGTKDKVACYQHWFRVLHPQISKTRFTDVEYARLAVRVKACGVSAWVKVAEGMPGRTDTQCRARWLDIQRGTLEFWRTIRRLYAENHNPHDLAFAIQRTTGIYCDNREGNGNGSGSSDLTLMNTNSNDTTTYSIASSESGGGNYYDSSNPCLRSTWKHRMLQAAIFSQFQQHQQHQQLQPPIAQCPFPYPFAYPYACGNSYQGAVMAMTAVANATTIMSEDDAQPRLPLMPVSFDSIVRELNMQSQQHL
eukprot:ANDGO_00416.mRNA.1 Myb-like protein N